MNHIYRTVRNEITGAVTAVSEHARRGGKKASRRRCSTSGFVLQSLASILALGCASASHASPEGGVVVGGEASITSARGNTTIHQNSQNAALNWQSFDIGVGEAVRFVQPNSSAVALNRVLGADPSRILGNLSANGKVFLVNPNGVLFGKGAQVTVGGLVASTRNISDSDFLSGRYLFSGNSNGSVVNEGSITADGGSVALLGANVSNQGVIAARLGTVALAAGDALTLDVAGDGLLNVTVDAGTVNALVRNGGLIQADGGQVLLTARSASDLVPSAVNNTGIIQAQTIENHNGQIRLLGDMQSGTVNADGTLDASAPNSGTGGFIETSAAHVQIGEDAIVTTAAPHGASGEWLIDPVEFRIAASGGDITGAQLSTSLGDGNVTILSSSGGSGTNGDILVNDTVTWSKNRLTLNAYRNIDINTTMNGSGAASLALQYGQGAVAASNTAVVNVNAPVNLPAGNNLSTLLGSDGVIVNYTVITNLGAEGSVTGKDLQGMSGDLTGNYALGGNIDAAATSAWESGAGFAPVGSDTAVTFSGRFEGLGHTISNLAIDRPNSGNSALGLFGAVGASGEVSNVGLLNAIVAGPNSNSIGVLAGANYGKVTNSYASGTVSGASVVGGLVGLNFGVLSDSHASSTVTASGDNAGGLAAYNFGAISNSYASGAVSAANYFSGGLLGTNMSVVTNSYATGAVTGNHTAGGLVAFNQYGSSISTSYSSGFVTGFDDVGGLVGFNNSSIANSYWDSTVNPGSGVGEGAGSTSSVLGLSTEQMRTASNFAGFVFSTTPGTSGNNWVMIDSDGSLNNASGNEGAVRPMLASEYSTGIANAHQLQLIAMAPDASYTLINDIDAAATGTATDVWSGSSFIPLGVAPLMYGFGTPFSGIFDGQGHTINDLTVNQPARDEVGLFTRIANNGVVENIGLVGGNVTGHMYVGGLVGRNYGSVTNSYATTTVTGRGNRVGGLVGNNEGGTISSSYATGAVSGAAALGGLAGGNSSGTIINSFATGTVDGTEYIGGLVGSYEDGTLTNSYATGAVTGSGENVGGLAGYIFSVELTNSYATGTVVGANNVGGLIGMRDEHGAGPSHLINNYWNSDVSAIGIGFDISAGATGLTTAQMRASANFASWDFASTWVSYEGLTNPMLRSFMTPLKVTAASSTATYDGQAHSAAGATYSVTPDSNNLFGTLNYVGGGTNAGTYETSASGLYSNQLGYLITYAPGSMTINPYAVSLIGSRTYDGSNIFDAGSFSIGTLVNGETLGLTGAGTVMSKDAGADKTVTLGTLSLVNGTGLASNYTLGGGQTANANITPKLLVVVNQLAGDKEYDGTTAATLTGGSLIGVVAGETVGLIQSGSFVSPTAGDRIAVTAADSLSGAAAANYTLAQPTGLTANITAVPTAETPPVSVSSTEEYRAAIGHVSVNAQAANTPRADSGVGTTGATGPNNAGAPAAGGSTGSNSNSAGLASTNLAGLNLVIVDEGIELPAEGRLEDEGTP